MHEIILNLYCFDFLDCCGNSKFNSCRIAVDVNKKIGILNKLHVNRISKFHLLYLIKTKFTILTEQVPKIGPLQKL